MGTPIYPNSALGKSFWSELEGGCFASRVWVVPSPAQVYAAGDKFYILKAPLNVKMEADYLQMPKGQTAAVSCPKQDTATQAHNEALYRGLVLPKLVSMVNTDPSFADLRTIYRSRVAAEWYRNLSESKHTTYAGLIDQDDISQWTTTTGWNPEQTFQQYVTSYTKGEWHVTSTVNKGDYTYEYYYTYGGVDLTSVPIQQVSSAAFGLGLIAHGAGWPADTPCFRPAHSMVPAYPGGGPTDAATNTCRRHHTATIRSRPGIWCVPPSTPGLRSVGCCCVDAWDDGDRIEYRSQRGHSRSPDSADWESTARLG